MNCVTLAVLEIFCRFLITSRLFAIFLSRLRSKLSRKPVRTDHGAAGQPSSQLTGQMAADEQLQRACEIYFFFLFLAILHFKMSAGKHFLHTYYLWIVKFFNFSIFCCAALALGHNKSVKTAKSAKPGPDIAVWPFIGWLLG